MVRLSTIAAFSVSLVGCGSDPGSTAALHDGGAHDAFSTDALTDVGSLDATAPIVNCGGTPTLRYLVKALELHNNGTTVPFAGATLSIDICPEATVQTDVGGIAIVEVRRGVPFVARVTATGHVTTILGESFVAVDDPATEHKTEVLLPLLPTAPAIPAYSTMAPSFVVATLDPNCPSTNVVVTVVGHPEAVEHCMYPTWPYETGESLACGASVGPAMFFTGLKGGTTVQIASNICQITGSPLIQTGNFPLEDGALTVANLR